MSQSPQARVNPLAMLSSIAYKPVLGIPNTWKKFPCVSLKQGLGKLSVDRKVPTANMDSAVSLSVAEDAEVHGKTIFWAFLFASLMQFNMANHFQRAESSPE